jgi:hypothetical protein
MSHPMKDELELATARVFEESMPEFAKAVRHLKAMGAAKSDVVRRVTKRASSSQFIRCGLLILVDKIWSEEA